MTRKQVNIKIKEEKVRKWEKYQQNNPQYSSLTDLIRLSVEREIAERESPTEQSPETGKDIAELKDEFNELDRTVKMLTDTVSSLRDDIRNTKPSDKHLRSEIFAALPVQGDMQGRITPSEMAEKLGGPIDTQTVAQTLHSLEREVGTVERVLPLEESDEMMYCKQQ